MKKTSILAVILLFACALVSAGTLTSSGGMNDAKVYGSNYKLIRNASEISDGYVVRTFDSSVVLDNESLNVELEAGSLAVFVRIGNGNEIYLIDGRMYISTDVSVTIMTPVTTYYAVPGTVMYVITDSADELAYVSQGQAEVLNLITNAYTTIDEGKYVDNAVSGFTPSNYTADIFALPKQEQEEATALAQTEPEPAEVVVSEPITAHIAIQIQVPEEPKDGALVKTFTYAGYQATLKAYIGYAELTYPEFVPESDIDAAAAAAVAAYPEYLRGITYVVTGPGRAEIYYPESYGVEEFNLATRLLEAELPLYIAQFTVKPQAAAATATAQSQVPEQTQEVTVPETTETQETTTEKTPLETAPRPETTVQEETVKTSAFSFGGVIGAVYGVGNDGDPFVEFPYTNGTLGAFWKNYTIRVVPYFRVGDFTFALRADVKFVDNKIQTDIYSIDTENGIPGYFNSFGKYIQEIGYKSELLTISIDRNSSLDFRSPINGGYDRLYNAQENLLGHLSLKAGFFDLTMFIDDLQMRDVLDHRSQFAGVRAGFTFGKLNVGVSGTADLRALSFDQMYIYPAADISYSLPVKDNVLEISLGAAAQYKKDVLNYMAGGVLNFRYKDFLTVGVGGSYNKGANFSGIMNNTPVSIEEFTAGDSVSVHARVGIDTEVFDFKLAADFPFALTGKPDDSILFKNTYKTRSGSPVLQSADVLAIQADLHLGIFTFTAGAAVNGFMGTVSDIVRATISGGDVTAAFAELINPETSTYFAMIDFLAPIGSGALDIYLRADIKTINSDVRIPFSIGAAYSF